jgi:DNA-binding NtrC family response regulator
MQQIGRKKKSPLIYLVDDQAVLLDLAEASLQNGGYKLKKFENPFTALSSLRKAKSKPDLIITDYAMGEMNGIDLIEKCKAVAPRLKTILLSGTIGAEILFNSPVKVDRFLGKPYQPGQLAETVKLVLDS